MINGINWAVSKGVHIISISQGTYEYDVALETAVNNAYDSGVLLIASSGNDDRSILMYPAKYDSVIAVGATDQNDERWVETPGQEGSNTGLELELSALGANINSTYPPNTYTIGSGTSAAVPHVTGTAALIFGSKVDPEYDSNNNGRWDNFEVRKKLDDTALDLADEGGPGRDGYYGYGLVNAWYSYQRPPGDITYDYRVDMRDIAYVSKYYGKTPGDPDWWKARVADVTIDNRVDVRDLSIVGKHYGQVDP